MVTNRTPITRRSGHHITPEALAAYEAGDYRALHRALSLRPWEASPLPLKVTPLGVDQGPPLEGPTAFALSWPKAQALQRELEAALRQAKQAVHTAPHPPASPAD
jgi:hypothetical protein